MESPEKRPESLPGCLLRVFWMILGNMALFFCAYFMAETPAEPGVLKLSAFDAAYAAVVAALLASRYVDIRSCGGATVRGTPATMAHFRRYALILLAVGIVGWAGAHAISYFR